MANDIASLRFGALHGTDYDQVMAKILSVQDCRRALLNEYANSKGAEGWEMISFRMMTDSYSGIESAYRIMWKKPAE